LGGDRGVEHGSHVGLNLGGCRVELVGKYNLWKTGCWWKDKVMEEAAWKVEAQ